MAIFKLNKTSSRRYIFAGLILVYVFSVPLLFKGFTRLWDVKPGSIKTDSVKYSGVIVLGGFSGAGVNGGGQFNRASDRFITATLLLTTGKAGHILISGGNGELVPGAYREAPWAKLQLQKLGIADSLILTEGNSRNTIENLEFSKKVLLAHKLKPPYLLVTSAFHMRRSLMICRKKGIDAVPYPCNYLTDNRHLKLTDVVPQADVLSSWEFYLKEVVGYVVNYFSK
ncbi:YdcF family protein [Mucilaginibacter sp. HD30]